MYGSVRAARIYQRKPLLSKPSQFKAKGWTETVEGYRHEANKLTRCILRNRRLMRTPYTWHVVINIETVHSPKQIADLWTKAVRTLRSKGIVALWIREPTRSGKVHYHLILRTTISRAQLERVVKEAMPKKSPGQKRAGWHKSLTPIRCDREWQLAHYVTKARIAGYRKGKKVEDYYAEKRLLFTTGLKIKKYGEIGDFWLKPKKQLWQEIIDIEKRIAEGLEKPNVERLCKHVHDFIGGYVSLKDIRRSFGFSAGKQPVQQWIDHLLATDWAEDVARAKTSGIHAPND